MNGFYGLTNELVADRHREYMHEAEQRRRIRQVAAPRDRWTHGFVTRVRTAGGDVTLRGAAGDVSVTSVSGAIRLLDSDLAAGRIESVSGAVTFRGAIAKGGTLDLQTHDAPIELTLAQGQGAVVDVSAFGGTISNAIPGVTGKASRGKPTRYDVGSGDAKISVRSLKGGVRLRRMMPRPNPS